VVGARRTRGLIAVALAVAGCGNVTSTARDRDCSEFADQRAAQAWLDAHRGDPDGLDEDGNGVACESLGGTTRTHAAVAPGGVRRARVVEVVDGDTIKVRVEGGRETVRLVGIDTPESKRPQTPVECGATRAAAVMHALLAGRPVTLRRDPTQDAVDRYGRTLAYVDVGGRDAGETMVREGWATPYVYAHVPFQRLRAYRAAERAAKRARAGVQGACAGDFHRAP
jgi:micrococcal nuclease